MRLYEDSTYQAFAQNMITDPGICFQLADWLEEKRWATRYSDYIAHLRAGHPVPEKLADGDWQETFGYAGERDTCNSAVPTATPPERPIPAFSFSCRDVRRIIAMQDGENDGPDWIAVGELWDGRFFVVRGGCDYTGWD